MIFVGIDPGGSGGIAFLDEEGVYLLGYADLDTADGGGLARILADVLELARGPVRAAVEKVGAMPKQGVASTFKFGRAAGVAEGVLAGLRISWEYVTPQAWTKIALAGRAKGEAGPDRKKRVLEAARARWPDAPLARVKDSGLADALWIAEALRKREGGA